MMTEFWNGLSLLKRLYDRTVEPVCGQYGLTRMEMDILLFLANNPTLDTATDIVERRRLTKSHVSSSVSSLERRGYLIRTYRGGNRKTAHLRVLPAADPILEDGRRAQRAYFQTIFRGFTSAETAQLEQLSAKIADNARTALMGGDSHVV